MAASSARAREIPRVDIRGAFVRRTDWAGAILRRADLSNADATGASFRGADFEGANLSGTILKGADLTGATNLTARQLSEAVIDETTLLPGGVDRSEVERLAGRTSSAG